MVSHTTPHGVGCEGWEIVAGWTTHSKKKKKQIKEVFLKDRGWTFPKNNEITKQA